MEKTIFFRSMLAMGIGLIFLYFLARAKIREGGARNVKDGIWETIREVFLGKPPAPQPQLLPEAYFTDLSRDIGRFSQLVLFKSARLGSDYLQVDYELNACTANETVLEKIYDKNIRSLFDLSGTEPVTVYAKLCGNLLTFYYAWSPEKVKRLQKCQANRMSRKKQTAQRTPIIK